ncbi:MAG: hypothetical protein ABI886_14030, partial [Betaproteobacteria bacterium]
MIKHRRPSRSVTTLARWALSTATAAALLAVGTGTAFANAGIGLAANFPSSTTVGATGVAANIDFQNVSTPITLTVTVNSLTLTPSCAGYTALNCTSPDNGVFQISPTGTGRTGTACAGVIFTFTPKPAATDGTLNVTPASTITLGVPGGGNDECIIDFTFDVLKAPATDALPDVGHPGVQTLPSGVVQGTASDSSLALGFGTTFITIQAAQPAIATTASGTVTAGGTITDQASLTNGVNATGTITFRAYGPSDPACASAPVFTSNAITVNGNGSYNSAPAFTANVAGTYHWIASYSGDANNLPVAGACGDSGESVVVTSANPTISTTASGTVKVGGTITDTATLALGTLPTGTITFNLYGPGDTTCTTSIFTTTKPVNGNGPYTSAAFTALAIGTYRWIASYGGDANNTAVSGSCGDSGESVVITQGTPTIATTASAGGGIGTQVTDSATLSGGGGLTGTITFTLYGPGDATCASAPAFTSNAIAVSGPGPYTSAPGFTTVAAGTFRWIAAYSGDANNAAVSGACGAANESVTITQTTPTIATTASAGGGLGTAVTDQATLSGGSTPGGTI